MKRFTWLILFPAVLQAQATVRVQGPTEAARTSVVSALTSEGFAIARADEASVSTEPLLLYPGKMDQSSITMRAALQQRDSIVEVRLSGTYRIAYAGQSQSSGDLPLTSKDRNAVAKAGWRKLLRLQQQLEAVPYAP